MKIKPGFSICGELTTLFYLRKEMANMCMWGKQIETWMQRA